LQQTDDLYEFPDGYTGRRTYVIVAGHKDLVPKIKTYYGLGGKNYLLPEYGGDGSGTVGNTATLMPDKLEYLSPMDGTLVTSRSTHRDHMRRHGVEEAGDIKMGSMSRNERSPMGRVGPDVQRALEQLRSR
jgi:hypothetical protein